MRGQRKIKAIGWQNKFLRDEHRNLYINRRTSQTQLQYYIKIHVGGAYMFRPLVATPSVYFNIILELCLTGSSVDLPLL
jgi:hypothetical protein